MAGSVGAPLPERDARSVPDTVRERREEADTEGLPLEETLADENASAERVARGEADALAQPLALLDARGDGDGDTEVDGTADREEPAEKEGLPLELPLEVEPSDGVGEEDAQPLAPRGVALVVPVTLHSAEADVLRLPKALGLDVALLVELPKALAVSADDAHALADAVAQPAEGGAVGEALAVRPGSDDVGERLEVGVVVIPAEAVLGAV